MILQAFIAVLLYRMILQAYAALRGDVIDGVSKLRDAFLKRVCLEAPTGASTGLLSKAVFDQLLSAAYGAVAAFRERKKKAYSAKNLPWPVDETVLESLFGSAASKVGILPKRDAMPSSSTARNRAPPPAPPRAPSFQRAPKKRKPVEEDGEVIDFDNRLEALRVEIVQGE